MVFDWLEIGLTWAQNFFYLIDKKEQLVITQVKPVTVFVVLCAKTVVADVKSVDKAEDYQLSRGRTSSAGSFDRMSDTQPRY